LELTPLARTFSALSNMGCEISRFICIVPFFINTTLNYMLMAYSVRPNGAGVNKRLFGGCFSGLAAAGQDTIVH